MKKKDFAAFQSNFFSKDDLSSPKVVTIEDVTEEELQGDGGKEQKPVVHFRGLDKKLVCNNINWDTIQDAYGEDSDDWRGKQVELYFDPSIMFGSKKVGGIRVRLPRGERANPQPASNGDRWTFQQAVDACGKAGISKERLIESLKNAGNTGWNPARDTQVVLDMIEAKAATEAFASMPSATTEEDIPF